MPFLKVKKYMIGDINIDFLKWNNTSQPDDSPANRQHILSSHLFERIFPHGFAQLVTIATRIWQGQESSGLDHYYTNRPEKISNIHAYYHHSSDHKLVMAIRHSKAEISKPRIIQKRVYKNFCPSSFKNEVAKISWFQLYMCDSVEVAVNIFTQEINRILDVMAPIKTIQVRHNYAPWISDNTRKLINECNTVQKTANENKTPQDWSIFKKM